MKSIRKELTRQILIGTIVLLVLSGVVLGIWIHLKFVEQFDDALEAKGEALISLVGVDRDVLEFDFTAGAMPEFEEIEEPDDLEEAEYFQLALASGEVLRKSPSLGEGSLPVVEADPEDSVFANVELPGGRPGRLALFLFSPEIDEPEEEDEEGDFGEVDEDVVELPPGVEAAKAQLVLTVARGREDLNELLASLYGALGLLAVLVTGGVFVLVRRAMRRGFAPVDSMNSQIAGIGPDSLEGRVQLEAAPEELAAVTSALNALLGRVESGFERERRFSSNVAHELRTPVTELRTACEVGSKWPEDPAAVQSLFDDVGDVATHMEAVVETLLVLARAESGTVEVEREPVPVRRLVDDCWRNAGGKGGNGGVTMENRIADDLSVQSDPHKLRMIIQNILDNAVGHGKPGAVIEAEAAFDEDRISLRFRNEAKDLRAEDVAHVFDRYWKKDASRSDRHRVGLGLSIAKALAGVLGIRIDAALQGGTFFVVQLVFPEGVESRP